MSENTIRLSADEVKQLCYVFEAGYRDIREQGAFQLRAEILPLEPRIMATLREPVLELSDEEAGTILVVVERGQNVKRRFIEDAHYPGRIPLLRLKQKLREAAGLVSA
jgi:hypothetical protein